MHCTVASASMCIVVCVSVIIRFGDIGSGMSLEIGEFTLG
jgi:hypothetical protein